MQDKLVKYAKRRLDLLKDDMGTITDISIVDYNKGLIIEFSNGMNLRLHDNELSYQAELYLESELDGVRNFNKGE